MKKTLMITTLALLFIPSVSRAQFFGGIVYDPTNFHNAVLRYYQLRMQLAQLQETYQEVVNQYRLAAAMAHNIQNMPERYKAYFSQWRDLATVPDVYQNTGAWVNGVNTGNLPTVLQGYHEATTPLEQYTSDELSRMTPRELQQVEAGYASVELADGANANAMATIGNIRADAQEVQNRIANLEDDSFSNKPALNGQVAVLNKINAANILMLRSLQDTNNLRLQALEQQVIRSKEQRDAAATAINTDIYQRDHMIKEVQQVTNGLGTSLQNYRMP
jgi:hypothetical protein